MGIPSLRTIQNSLIFDIKLGKIPSYLVVWNNIISLIKYFLIFNNKKSVSRLNIIQEIFKILILYHGSQI
ncbi:MAG: hypothetical protein BAJALOKI2v1_150011 [Promethearchaeota archaeon]|nr:MAG: hypothetical protein BAJALOKI2v1_150011 [Candidatus Lokiarchaeota archaeon]